MTIEIINGIRVITPSEGCWLYCENDKIISDQVYLGIYAPADEWTEITEEDKKELEQLWEQQAESGEVAAEDYIKALESLGVNFNG